MNSIVIFITATNRVVTWAEVGYGVPVPEDYFDVYDPVIHDYRIGLQTYNDGDFDEATDLLTDAACAAYGISTAHKSKVYKDEYIAQGDERYLWVDATKSVSLSAPALSAQNKYLGISFVDTVPGSPCIQVAGGPNGIDMLPTNYYWYAMWSPEQRESTISNCYIRVTKYLADGTVDTSATDTITLSVDKGTLLTFTAVMVAGVANFIFLPGVEGGYLHCEALSNQSDTIGGTGSLWIQAFELNTNYKKRTYITAREFFLSGAITTTSGKAGDGRVFQFAIPAAPPQAGYDYPTKVTITAIELHAAADVSVTNFDVNLELSGTPTTKTGTVTIPIGSNRVRDEMTSQVFAPGDIINLLITGGTATDVNVRVEFE